MPDHKGWWTTLAEGAQYTITVVDHGAAVHGLIISCTECPDDIIWFPVVNQLPMAGVLRAIAGHRHEKHDDDDPFIRATEQSNDAIAQLFSIDLRRAPIPRLDQASDAQITREQELRQELPPLELIGRTEDGGILAAPATFGSAIGPDYRPIRPLFGEDSAAQAARAVGVAHVPDVDAVAGNSGPCGAETTAGPCPFGVGHHRDREHQAERLIPRLTHAVACTDPGQPFASPKTPFGTVEREVHNAHVTAWPVDDNPNWPVDERTAIEAAADSERWGNDRCDVCGYYPPCQCPGNPMGTHEYTIG